jgi:uncharacterized lipoprotein YddW (UPF0748 family)
MRASLPALAVAIVLLVLTACSSDSGCGCTSSCGGDVVYCAEGADGNLVCHGSLEEFPWYQQGQANPPEKDAIYTPGDPDVIATGKETEEPADASTSLDQAEPDAFADGGTLPPWNGQGEMRGIWVTRWDYSSAADVTEIMQNISEWGFNAVYFQVRGTADAYYKSAVEPWSKDLSGTLGQDPGWNPLAVAIDEAHARELELHAWLNTFPAWSGTAPIPPTDPPHILYAHPDWRVVDSSGQPQAFNNSYTFVSPGIPGVKDHIVAVVSDIATNYPVDGIHFDYIRYPGPQYSHDSWTLEAFEEAKFDTPGLIWGNFQRQLLSDLVGDAYDAIVAAAPAVKVTSAVWGIYKDDFEWGGTSQGYYDYYQDSHAWVDNGSMDAICPMIYWPLTDPKGGWTDFATLADHHLAGAGTRHVYLGMKSDQPAFEEIEAEINYVRQLPAPGFVMFAYSTVLSKGYGPLLKQTVLASPAPLPAMPWK